MKIKIISILPAILCMGSALEANAQPLTLAENTQPQDTVIIKQNQNTLIVETTEKGKVTQISHHKKRSRNSRDFLSGTVIDFGFNDYGKKNLFTGNSGKDDFLVLNTSKSTNFTIYTVMGEMAVTKWLSFTGGVGVEWTNYFFEEGWTIASNNGVTERSGKYNAGGIRNTLSKSKLLTIYMNVPLMIQFNIPKRNNSFWSWYRGFFAQAGIIGGLKIGSHTKVKVMDNGHKEKDHSSFNLNVLRYGLTARAGYGVLGIYVNYQMTPMFEKNHGPELYPFSVGISLHFGFD